ncbi:hypothetical protein E2P81_ATG01531 [Venturia nashicola]|nr:hypothetical protein E2P81_ATG01531 [Venturia nashicola]
MLLRLCVLPITVRHLALTLAPSRLDLFKPTAGDDFAFGLSPEKIQHEFAAQAATGLPLGAPGPRPLGLDIHCRMVEEEWIRIENP